MEIKEKQLNMLGLAMRARQLVSGDEAVQAAISSRNVYLVVCAKDASEKTLAKYQMKCERDQIPLNTEFTKYEISHAIGKSRTVAAIANQGMAKKFMTYEVKESGETHE